MWIPLYLHRAQVVQKTAETCGSPPCGARDRWGRPGMRVAFPLPWLAPFPPLTLGSCPLFPQPHLRGHHLLHRLSGSAHGGGSHALVPPEDPEGRPAGVCGGHAGLRHLHLPHLCGSQEQHRGRLRECSGGRPRGGWGLGRGCGTCSLARRAPPHGEALVSCPPFPLLCPGSWASFRAAGLP